MWAVLAMAASGEAGKSVRGDGGCENDLLWKFACSVYVGLGVDWDGIDTIRLIEMVWMILLASWDTLICSALTQNTVSL